MSIHILVLIKFVFITLQVSGYFELRDLPSKLYDRNTAHGELMWKYFPWSSEILKEINRNGEKAKLVLQQLMKDIYGPMLNSAKQESENSKTMRVIKKSEQGVLTLIHTMMYADDVSNTVLLKLIGSIIKSMSMGMLFFDVLQAAEQGEALRNIAKLINNYIPSDVKDQVHMIEEYPKVIPKLMEYLQRNKVSSREIVMRCCIILKAVPQTDLVKHPHLRDLLDPESTTPDIEKVQNVVSPITMRRFY